jgi:hypothetical protein
MTGLTPPAILMLTSRIRDRQFSWIRIASCWNGKQGPTRRLCVHAVRMCGNGLPGGSERSQRIVLVAEDADILPEANHREDLLEVFGWLNQTDGLTDARSRDRNVYDNGDPPAVDVRVGLKRQDDLARSLIGNALVGGLDCFACIRGQIPIDIDDRDVFVKANMRLRAISRYHGVFFLNQAVEH